MNRRHFLTIVALGFPILSFGKMGLFNVEVERDKNIILDDVNKKDIPAKEIPEDKILNEFVSNKNDNNEFLKKFTEDNYNYLVTNDDDDVPLPKLPRSEPQYNHLSKRSKLNPRGTRRLKLYNPHTKEHYNKVYYSNGKYNKKALRELDYFVRDFREKKVIKIDPELINLTYSIQQTIHPDKPLVLLSGYRTKKTNEMLRKKSRLVAKNSFHTKGAAFDIAPYDGSKSRLVKIKRLATNMKVGGVGYYKSKGFVHIDTGSVRYWG